MVVLHGWYESGKVEITDKKKPAKSAKVILLIPGENGIANKKPLNFRKNPARGIWQDREDIVDTLDFVHDIRGRIERREN